MHPTNGDSTHAATFGFELSEEPNYEYPLILSVEPYSPAEGAGLQSRDILLEINKRKTKGLNYDKVKKEIEKAKRDGRLEMLVADQETFDYCNRTKKPFREPEIKVKHIFPKSRSSASFHKLLAAATALAPTSSKDNTEQTNNSSAKYDDSSPSYSLTATAYHQPTLKEPDPESEENETRISFEQKVSPVLSSETKTVRNPAVSFDLPTPVETLSRAPTDPNKSPTKIPNSAYTPIQQFGASSTVDQDAPNTSQSITSLRQTSTKTSKPSKTKAIPHAINNLFHKIGHPKSSKRS